jgi:hypothetical protein
MATRIQGRALAFTRQVTILERRLFVIKSLANTPTETSRRRVSTMKFHGNSPDWLRQSAAAQSAAAPENIIPVTSLSFVMRH